MSSIRLQSVTANLINSNDEIIKGTLTYDSSGFSLDRSTGDRASWVSEDTSAPFGDEFDYNKKLSVSGDDLPGGSKLQIVYKYTEVGNITDNMIIGGDGITEEAPKNIIGQIEGLSDTALTALLSNNEENLITEANKLKTFVSDEADRLAGNDENTMRQISLNKYYAKKYDYMSRTLMFVILAITSFMFMRVLNQRGSISDSFFTILSVFIMVSLGIYIFVSYIDMKSRYHMNFDEYDWKFDAKKNLVAQNENFALFKKEVSPYSFDVTLGDSAMKF